MGDGYDMIRTYNGVVHWRGEGPVGLACRGRIARSTATAVFEPTIVTCLWCISGMTDETLRWFKWANELTVP